MTMNGALHSFPDINGKGDGAPGRSRTRGLPLTRRSLYQLSYRGFPNLVYLKNKPIAH